MATAHFCNHCGHAVVAQLVSESRSPRRERIGLGIAIGLIAVIAAVVAIFVLWPSAGPPPPGVVPATPVATATATVDERGANLALPAGIVLAVPAGAVDRPVEVSIGLLARAPLDGPPGGLAFDARGSRTSFARPLELIVPLDERVTADQAASAIGGTLDRGVLTIEHPVTVERRDGRTVLVLPVGHFSVPYLMIAGGVLVIKTAFVAYDALKGWIWAPPAAVAPIATPIYHQGDGPECLATSVTMVTRAIKPSSKEIWRVMEGAKLTTHGQSPLGLWAGSGMRDEVQRITGATPEVSLWQPLLDAETGPLLGAMKRYIRQQLAAGHPVVFSSTSMQMGGSSDITHAVVLVGYDADGYWVANPQNVRDDAAALRKHTEAELGITWAVRQSYVTFVVGAPLSSERTRVTINVPPNAVWFQTVAGSSAPIYAATWDGARPGGIRWSQHAMLSSISDAGTPVDAVPADVTQLYLGRPDVSGSGVPTGGFEVVNAGDTAVSATVTLAIRNLTTGADVALVGNATTLRQTLELPPHAMRRATFVVDTMRLRPPAVTAAQQFQISATVVAGSATDTTTFEVMLAAATAKPLVGVWEGTAFGAGPMVLTITEQTGNNFTGTWLLQGTTLGIAGTWDAAHEAWTLTLWELGTTPRFEFPAPGSLLPHSGGRLRLTAPGGLLAKRGAPVGSGADNPYELVEDYLRTLPKP